MINIAVISCAHHACLESANIKGRLLAEAIGADARHKVYIPVNSKGLIASLSEADYAVISTYGGSDKLFDQREDGSYPAIASCASIKRFPSFDSLRLVFVLACSAAGGQGDQNIAAALSRCIAKDGIVIANRYTIIGTSYHYRAKNGKQGWVAYQNGRVVISEEHFPARITMQDVYDVFLKYRMGLIP